MGLLVFVGVAAVVVGGPLAWMALRMKRRRGETNMVLIRHASSEPDKAITIGAWRSAGIQAHVVESGYHGPEFWSRGKLPRFTIRDLGTSAG